MKTEVPATFQVKLKVLLANTAGEFLLLKGTSTSRDWAHTFDFPGGRINRDEVNLDFQKIIDREIREELGPDVQYELQPNPVSLAKVCYDDTKERFFVLFKGKYLGGTIQLSEEHCGYEWRKVEKADVSTLFSETFQELMHNYFTWNHS